jgi:hypothetical protein
MPDSLQSSCDHLESKIGFSYVWTTDQIQGGCSCLLQMPSTTFLSKYWRHRELAAAKPSFAIAVGAEGIQQNSTRTRLGFAANASSAIRCSSSLKPFRGQRIALVTKPSKARPASIAFQASNVITCDRRYAAQPGEGDACAMPLDVRPRIASLVTAGSIAIRWAAIGVL